MFLSVCVFPGNRTHNLLRCWRNALPLSHTLLCKYGLFFYFLCALFLSLDHAGRHASIPANTAMNNRPRTTTLPTRTGEMRALPCMDTLRFMYLFITINSPFQCTRKPWPVLRHQRLTGRWWSLSHGRPGGDGPARWDLRHAERAELQRAGFTVRHTQPRLLQLWQLCIHLRCKAWILSHITSKRCWTGCLAWPATNKLHSALRACLYITGITIRRYLPCIECIIMVGYFPHRICDIK